MKFKKIHRPFVLIVEYEIGGVKLTKEFKPGTSDKDIEKAISPEKKSSKKGKSSEAE